MSENKLSSCCHISPSSCILKRVLQKFCLLHSLNFLKKYFMLVQKTDQIFCICHNFHSILKIWILWIVKNVAIEEHTNFVPPDMPLTHFERQEKVLRNVDFYWHCKKFPERKVEKKTFVHNFCHLLINMCTNSKRITLVAVFS